MSNKNLTCCSVVLVLPVLVTPAFAYEINDKLSIGGVLASTIQCQNVSDVPASGNTCEQAVPLQPELSFRPTKNDEIFFKLGYTAGNGLNNVTPFSVSPWAADMEDDLKNINGRNRDTLLVAWYKYTFDVSAEQSLGITIGIIDSTDYLDENAYANDEYTQFMNSVLTNGPNVFLPSYDIGVALAWVNSSWSLHAVVMDVGENDDGNNFSFYGLQVGYSVNNSLGAGNYRLLVAGASKDFLDHGGTQLEKREGAIISFDQEFGEMVGGWIRFGRQTDHAAVDHDVIYSGGIDFKGVGWGRIADNIGMGYAYFDGGNQAISHSHVIEAYYRWQLGDLLGLTADIQHMKDEYHVGDDPVGWIYSLRAAVEF